MPNLFRKQAFTMIELLVVVMLIAIIAGFAMAGFQKSMDKGEERNAILSLQTVRTGMEIYYARHSSYPSTALSNVTQVNSTLQLNLVPRSFSISCSPTCTTGFDCSISNATWTIVTQKCYTGAALTSDEKPHCTTGLCPACTTTSCPGT